MASARKRSYLVKVRTLFRERNYTNILERNTENINAVENEDCEPLI